MNYESLRNGLEDRNIPTSKVIEHLTTYRNAGGCPGAISKTSMMEWKRQAGVMLDRPVKDSNGHFLKDSNGFTIYMIDRRKFLTPMEVAAITVQGLWEPVLKEMLRAEPGMLDLVPKLKSKNVTFKNIPEIYDRWMTKTGGREAPIIIGLIHHVATYDETRKKIGTHIKKEIPVSTARLWIKELGGKYLAKSLCPPEITAKWLKIAKERTRYYERTSI
jgi:hypothetical protein